MEDFGLSAFAAFFTQSPSFLAHQRAMQTARGANNAQSLFGIADIPCDNQVRVMLDPVPPQTLYPVYDQIYDTLRAHGILQLFRGVHDSTLIALDGTWYHASQKIHCPCCSSLEHANGQTTYYLIEHTSLPRVVEPVVVPASDPKQPRISRWSLELPRRSLPLEELRVMARTPLFEREVVLYEEIHDERGARNPRSLGQARWIRTPEQAGSRLVLTISSPPVSDRLFLETDDGDNPAIDLHGFQLSYPVTRLLFKVNEPADFFLYYGNRETAPPRYDLVLAAEQFLVAERSIAKAGPEEQLKGSSWTEGPPLAGVKGILFWGVLVLVVIALLAVISRLLPKAVD